MQHALIRKKLEEQRENFRRRQEAEAKTDDAQGVNNPHSNSNVAPKLIIGDSQPKSPSLFTPTAVLRQMTAERDGGAADVPSTNQGRGGAILGAHKPNAAPTNQMRLPADRHLAHIESQMARGQNGTANGAAVQSTHGNHAVNHNLLKMKGVLIFIFKKNKKKPLNFFWNFEKK